MRLLVAGARGLGLGAPAFVVALRALGAAFADDGEVHHGVVVVRDLGGIIARHVLPAAGARAPASHGVEIRLDATLASRKLVVVAERDCEPPALDPYVIGALELTELAGQGDEAALRGDVADARARYLTALERAPRHPDLAARVAAIDLLAGGRAEAALSVLVDAMPAVDAGVLGGELLALVGDADGAYAAYRRAAEDEPFGPLAALAWLRAAKAAQRPGLHEEAVDQALVRAPSMPDARWERLGARLDRGDVRGALADAEHLEADAVLGVDRVEVCLRAGEAFAAHGHLREAKSRFERALRVRPENATAVLALARSLRDLGQGSRALDLFARAATLAEREPSVAAMADLELARSLVEVAGNTPAAIARAARVPPDGIEGLEARALEGELRASMGDATGAARVFGRLRALAEAFPSRDPWATRAARFLLDASRVEEKELGDVAAARESAALALRLAPTNGAAAAELRRLSRDLRAAVEAPRPDPLPTEAPAPPALDVDGDDSEQAARIEDLTAKLRANPADVGIANGLAALLERAGRDLELLSLLSARVDEAIGADRATWSSARRRVLARLEETAHAEGRAGEADLYALMRASDPDVT